MHLSSMTLKGFKSFASATTLNFEPGITCVVGPNGSGKSNVVDALAWVMGEQGAKSLRGGKMEDVIFMGTSTRAPLGRAEVLLTIDNSDGVLPIEFAEVTIGRTMFRNGGSEYSINGSPCRLLDIQELLSDSGIGREMHVIVGQGQLDSVLQASVEDRRGFIEEAAGVLKHRKRKEKALRKLDAMQANLTRLQDLTAELRRQLKPLGRQAEVARRAVVIQSDARDARLRLLADDLVQMRHALAAEVADETALRERRAEVEKALHEAQARLQLVEDALVQDSPLLAQSQQTWYALAALKERFMGTASLAAERVRVQDLNEEPAGRDPEVLEHDARALRAEEFELGREVERERTVLADAVVARGAAEEAHSAEERRVSAVKQAEADRREGMARLVGRVAAARSRVEAGTAEIERLDVQVADARARAEKAQQEFHALEAQIAGLDDGELGLDAQHEEAAERLDLADRALSALRAEESDADRERATAAARLEALQIGLDRRDGTGALLDPERAVPGVVGAVSALLQIEAGYEAAVGAALGPLADAVAVTGAEAAAGAIWVLRESDGGRASLVLIDAQTQQPNVPFGMRRVRDFVRGPEDLIRSLTAFHSSVIVDDVRAPEALQAVRSGLTVVTLDGDVVGPHVAVGGTSRAPSLLEVQAAVDAASAALEQAQHRVERARFQQIAVLVEQEAAASTVSAALDRLHDSDARMAAVAEQLGALGQAARAGAAESDRLTQARREAEQARDADSATLTELETRLAAAEQERPADDIDIDHREIFAERARVARQAEVDARLSVRTGEERCGALAARAEQLEKAASAERAARVRAIALRERREREALVAVAVSAAIVRVLERLDASLAEAAQVRDAAEAQRAERDGEVGRLRISVREWGGEMEKLTDSVHRDEVARAEQRMRIEQMEIRGIEEYGVEPEALIAEYGPDQLVPPSPQSPGDEPVELQEPQPYNRVEQEKRLKEAERGLALLGKVNPLALEEFDAMEERHRFLTEQLEDLKKSRNDLLQIIKDVDDRVQEVFSQAFEDTAREFERVFARLFPGGEGRLILTDPSDLLNTGVDVEARPPGKKVKRLSLLSGGERSLTAVAFLVALFKARPSPFYVLDEVEAALDDVNLGRLIDIIEELRDSSQLIVITHQKRTMEVADALYGVTMRSDGVTQVISQKLRDTA